ncbi:MAG: DUF5719 family protein [Marmoricola sp.]
MRPGSWRALALPTALVALVVAMSLAGTGRQAPTSAEPMAGTAVTLSRSLSCVPDAPSSSTRIGTVPASTSGYTVAAGSRGRVVFAPAAAASGYASQWAAGKTWRAARACPSPADDWWFVGAGAGISHRSMLTLDNPRSNDANVTIAVYGPNGQVEAPGLTGLLVPAGQSVRLDLESIAPSLGDLTVHVSAVRGLVAASLFERWAQSAVVKPVSSWVPAAAAPARQTQVIGIPTKLNHATLFVANPGASSAVVHLKVVNAAATFAPTTHQTLTIPPATTSAVAVDDLLAKGPGSLELQSSAPVTAGLRAIRGAAETYATPAARLGAQSTAGLPGGVPATLVLTSPTSSSVGILGIDGHGKTVLSRTVALPAGQIVTVSLPTTATAIRLTQDRRGMASGAVILDRGTMAVIGLVPTANAARVPAVVARPY